MRPLEITWIYEPHDSPLFHLGRDDRFVSEVSRHAGTEIPYVEGRLDDVAPRHGFILLNSFGPSDSLRACEAERRTELAARLVAIDVSSSRIFERVLEPLSIAGAIDVPAHLAWQSSEGAASSQGFYGLQHVADRLDVRRDLASSTKYCRMWCEQQGGLPWLLAKYLVTLNEVRNAAAAVAPPPVATG